VSALTPRAWSLATKSRFSVQSETSTPYATATAWTIKRAREEADRKREKSA
jgi:hypothetical protein